MSIFNVERDAVPVGLLGNVSTTLTVVSGDTLYYADNSQVSPTNNQGSLTSGGSATFTNNVWIVSASASSVSQTFTAASTGGSSGSASPTFGGNLPDGAEPASTSPAIEQTIVSAWNPERLTRGYEPDTLQALRSSTEEQMIADGGLLYTTPANTGLLNRTSPALMRPGPGGGFRPSFQKVGTNGQITLPIDGCISHDNTGWVIETDVAVDPTLGNDFFALGTNTSVLNIASGASGVLQLFKTDATHIGLQLKNLEGSGGLGGSTVQASITIVLATPILTTASITNNSSAMTAITGTVQPTVGTMVTGRGIPQGTYVTASGGVSGAWTATLSQNATLTLTATNVTFADIPLATAQQASQTANGTTASSTTVTAWAGTAIVPGMAISASDGSIPKGTYVQAYSAGTITLSQAATGSATVALTVTDYPILPRRTNGNEGGFCPNSAVAAAWDGYTTNFYPLIPFAPVSAVYNPGTFVSSPVSGSLSLILGNNRRNATTNISQTATGSATGTAVTGWGGLNTGGALAPAAGIQVFGPNVRPNTFITGSVTGVSGSYNFTLTNAVTTNGSQALAIVNPPTPRPWSSDTVFGGFGAQVGDTTLWTTLPAFYRNPRVAGGPITAYNTDAISADVSTTSGATFNADLVGVVGKYTGSSWVESTETAPTTRSAQITWLGSSSCLRLGLDEFQGRAIPTFTGVLGTGTVVAGAAPGTNATTGWTPQAPQTAAGTLNTAGGTSGGTSYAGTITAWAGTNAPAQGAAVTGTNIPANTVVLGVSGSTGAWTLYLNNAPTLGGSQSVTVTPPALAVGMTIAGAGIPFATKVTAVSAGNVQLSNATQASASASATMNTTATVTAYAGTVAPTIGSQVSGVNIAASTTVTDVTGSSGNYTLTLSQAASGSGTNSITITPAATGVALAAASVTVAFADAFARWDRYHTAYGGTAGQAAPIAYKVRQLVGYSPALTFASGAATDSNNFPVMAGLTDQQAFGLYGLYASTVIQALQARYPTHIDQLQFWNEPSVIGNWGTAGRFGICWASNAAQINADQTAAASSLRLGGVGENWNGNFTGTNSSAFHDAVFARAQTWGQPMPAVWSHNYDPRLAIPLESVLGLKNRAALYGFTPIISSGELDYTQAGSDTTPTSRFAREPLAGPNSVHQAAYLLAILWELNQVGATATVFTLGQFQGLNTASSYSGLLSNGGASQGQPAVTPQGAIMQLLWRHVGGSVLKTVSTTYPDLRCFGTIKGTVRTLTYGSWRTSEPYKVRQIQFGVANLPTTFTWKLRRYDYRDRGDGRVLTIAVGDQSNFPRATDLAHVGFAQLEIAG